MDFGNAPKTAPVGSVGVVTRSDVIAAHGSVPVELSPEQTVQSVGEAVRVDLRTQDRQIKLLQEQDRQAQRQRSQSEQPSFDAGSRTTESRTVIEPETHTVVQERTDPETGEVISQLPNETLLKLRIYSRQLEERTRERDASNAQATFEHSA